jgi:hypothetical protein
MEGYQNGKQSNSLNRLLWQHPFAAPRGARVKGYGKMWNIDNLTVDDLVASAFDNPTELIGLATACGVDIRTRALALLRQGFALADERSRTAKGRSLWEDFFAEYGKRHPVECVNERWDQPQLPDGFARLQHIGLWVPIDGFGRWLGKDLKPFRCCDPPEHYQWIEKAWLFPADPRSLRGIWSLVDDKRCLISGKDSYYPCLGKVVAVTTDPTEYAWRVLQRNWRGD